MIPGPDFRTGVVRDIGLAIERRGWMKTARESGLDRSALHRTFGRHGRGHPTLTTIDRLLPHLGLQLTIEEVGQ